MTTTPSRVALGAGLSAAILLVYRLFRPGSLEFSIAFLIAPSLALLWSVSHDAPAPERRMAVAVTWLVVVASAATVLANWVRG
jgi:hypothetical protein